MSRYVLSQLIHASKVYGVNFNCWERTSEKVITELRILGAKKHDSSFKMERPRRYLKDIPLILIVDELSRPTY